MQMSAMQRIARSEVENRKDVRLEGDRSRSEVSAMLRYAITTSLLLTVSLSFAHAQQVSLAPCSLPGLSVQARCGTHEVWENRTAKKGRRIPIYILVLPALGN